MKSLFAQKATKVESMSRDTEEKYSAELKAVERRKDLGIQIQHIAEEEKKVSFEILHDYTLSLRYFSFIFYCKSYQIKLHHCNKRRRRKNRKRKEFEILVLRKKRVISRH